MFQPRAAAVVASAMPIRPEERFPTNRTASMGSCVGPAVMSKVGMERGFIRDGGIRTGGGQVDDDIPSRSSGGGEDTESRPSIAAAAVSYGVCEVGWSWTVLGRLEA